jgi:hypothetical protein
LEYLQTAKLAIQPKQYMKTYHCIVKLSDEYNVSEDLYRIYKEKVESYIKIIRANITKKQGNPEAFLQEYKTAWEKYTLFVHSMNKVMNYLDRFHLKNAGDQSLTQTSLQLYRQNIYKPWLPELRKSILEQIRKDRENDVVNYELIKHGI